MSGVAPPADAGRSARLISGAIDVLWAWVIPALSAALVVRYLFPSATDPFEPAAGDALARFAGEHSAALWAGFFVIFSVVARYWASSLPGVEPEETDKNEGRSRARGAVSVVLTVSIAALAALFARASLFQSNSVLSSSMLPTLPVGAEIAVNKLSYGLKLPGFARSSSTVPRRGDVIVFQSPDASEPGELVKRVIGLPGDRIGISVGRPVINGWLPPACLAGRYPVVGADGLWTAQLLVEFLDDRSYLTLFPVVPQATPFPEYTVKPGEVFVLGDNRPVSADSRAWNHGRGAGVPLDSISGRVERTLVGPGHDGRFELANVLKPLGLDLNLGRIDARKLDENVRACLKLRPKDTMAPKPGEPKVSK